MTTTYRVGIEIKLSEENFTVDVKSGKERKAEEIVKELAVEKYGLSDLVARGANLDYRFNVTELQTEFDFEYEGAKVELAFPSAGQIRRHIIPFRDNPPAQQEAFCGAKLPRGWPRFGVSSEFKMKRFTHLYLKKGTPDGVSNYTEYGFRPNLKKVRSDNVCRNCINKFSKGYREAYYGQ